MDVTVLFVAVTVLFVAVTVLCVLISGRVCLTFQVVTEPPNGLKLNMRASFSEINL